jgi:hypothetical protein
MYNGNGMIGMNALRPDGKPWTLLYLQFLVLCQIQVIREEEGIGDYSCLPDIGSLLIEHTKHMLRHKLGESSLPD